MNTLAIAKCSLDVHHGGMPWWGYLIGYGVRARVRRADPQVPSARVEKP